MQTFLLAAALVVIVFLLWSRHRYRKTVAYQAGDIKVTVRKNVRHGLVNSRYWVQDAEGNHYSAKLPTGLAAGQVISVSSDKLEIPRGLVVVAIQECYPNYTPPNNSAPIPQTNSGIKVTVCKKVRRSARNTRFLVLDDAGNKLSVKVPTNWGLAIGQKFVLPREYLNT